MQIDADDVHKLFARLGVFHKCSGEIACCGDGVLLLDSAHRHTHMLCFYDDGNAEGLQGVLYAVFDLFCEAFLYLKTASIGVDDARYFAESYDGAVGDVGYVGFADEWD